MKPTKLRVPYVTSWSAETTTTAPCLIQLPNNRGIAYPDETIGDRDSRGILWARTPLAHGQGTPNFGQVHSARQRRAMRKLLCQVCANPADHDSDGTLWVLPDHRTDWPNWPNGMGITEPPICVPCLNLSIRACPALRHSHAIIRATHAPLAGVQGGLYTPTPTGPPPQSPDPEILHYDSSRLPWLLAFRLVRELIETTILDP
ncbi:hypothetical protein DFQ13_104588 [Actinokineospora spheciospongiae]|nr:hypothetical protein DFQ13_104588 [Actinokineospora spheciospongiae]